MLQIELYIIRNIFISFCHRQNVKENNPHTHKRQIDVSRGKLNMDASPNILYHAVIFGATACSSDVGTLVESLSVVQEISGVANSHSQYIVVQENHNLWRSKSKLSTMV